VSDKVEGIHLLSYPCKKCSRGCSYLGLR